MLLHLILGSIAFADNGQADLYGTEAEDLAIKRLLALLESSSGRKGTFMAAFVSWSFGQGLQEAQKRGIPPV